MFAHFAFFPAVVFCNLRMLTRDTMVTDSGGDPPLLQRLYNRIWLLAALAILFWTLSYVVWGYVDIWTIPPAPGVVT